MFEPPYVGCYKVHGKGDNKGNPGRVFGSAPAERFTTPKRSGGGSGNAFFAIFAPLCG
jgi:hypothetical protein